ncbi:hypothetical protein Leryth_012381 [Lithospermum erythrorhizon]|nr:hypothetical protein Leryth_012381 [Lithospermum erythrorhizon]
MMADQEDEELKMALRLSMQHDPPEPKRSKPGEDSGGGGGDEAAEELRIRRKQRELMAAAAEKRMNFVKKGEKDVNLGSIGGKNVNLVKGEGQNVNLGMELSEKEAHQLFSMIFGDGVTMDILAQWSNQGIRFSPDPDTSMGLVQHEGGPCGVLAAIQAFVLKYLLFPTEEIGSVSSLGSKKLSRSLSVTTDIFSSLTEDKRSRALVKSMAEILFLCGNSKMAVIASLNIPGTHIQDSGDTEGDEIIAKALDGLSIQSGSDLQKFLRINTYTSLPSALNRLEEMLPLFRCRLGAMLFLISALLSRGLDSIQSDRDDPSQPLVTAPFGHASQEIVNLLLSGMAVANVFDGKIDLGGGMFVNGISSSVEVGFLTLLESLNFCKVGDHLKCPKWPIWVVGSESHYTVLFALDTKVQEENELESRETQIRKAFDVQDQSGGGGFISVEGFHQVLRETGINLPAEKIELLSNTGFIVWSEFWQSLLDLDKSSGGLKDSSGLLGKKVFDLYHFNGIAKSVSNGSQASSESVTIQRPRLTKLRVSVPPRWTPEEYMADVSTASSSKNEASGKDTAEDVSKPEPVQHAPLVDCIRTRWPRAVCNWEGDSPSIV